MFAQVRSRMTGRWKGVIISEGLEEPSLLNGFDVYRARISKNDQPIDDRGHKERWHLYWVRATDKQIEALSSQIKDGWYAHFWKDKKSSWQFFAVKSSSSSPETSRPGTRLSNMASLLESPRSNLTFQQTRFLGHHSLSV